jgi:NADH:ubiquinone oxidoreductase subunit 5 (subunit L)/multisubunit Na+/H+ antiporter MnhA subunit
MSVPAWFPILSVTLFAPLVGALLILVVSREAVKTIRRVGIAFAFLTLILATIIWVSVARSEPSGMQFEESYPWIQAFDVQFHLGVDALNAPWLFLVALLASLMTFYLSHALDERVKDYYVLFLLLEVGALGVFLALDRVLFYVSWEVVLLPMLLLISMWGGKRRAYAAIDLMGRLGKVISWVFGWLEVHVVDGLVNLVGRLGKAISWICGWLDIKLVDGLVNLVGRAGVLLSDRFKSFDLGVVDGTINGVGSVVRASGRAIRPIQTGKVQNYLLLASFMVLTLILTFFMILFLRM